MDEYERVIRQTLRRVREEQGLTQAELAKRLGVHRQTISRTETGKRPLELGEFFDWAQALGVDYKVIFSDIAQHLPKAHAA